LSKEDKEVVDYLLHHKFPIGANKQLKGRITFKSCPYTIFGNYLHHQRKDEVLWRALKKMDVSTILFEFHEGICEGHFVERLTAKIFRGGYHWLIFFKNAIEYYRTCDVCQAFANKYVVHVPFHPIPPLGTFEKWGIDLMGPLFITPRTNKFLLVAIDYFTKWAEVRF
jgi:hypothetical protein